MIIFLKNLPKIVRVFFLINPPKWDFFIIFLHQLLYPWKIKIINLDYSNLTHDFFDGNLDQFSYGRVVFNYLPLQNLFGENKAHFVKCFNYDLESLLVEHECEYKQVKVESGDVVFDCGANIGVFSILAAPLASVVYAFEPAKDNLLSLEHNIKINSANKVEIVPKALSDVDSHTRLVLGDSLANYLIREGEPLDAGAKTELVETITLDGFVKQKNITKVDFIKLDVEAFEEKVLLGTKEVLKRDKPKLSISIQHKHMDFYRIPWLLHNLNPDYRMYVKRRKYDLCVYAY